MLVSSLLFAKPQFRTYRSSSSNFGNQTVGIQRVVEISRGGFKTDTSQGRVSLVYRIKKDSGLVQAAESACKDRDVQDGINHLIDELKS